MNLGSAFLNIIVTGLSTAKTAVNVLKTGFVAVGAGVKGLSNSFTSFIQNANQQLSNFANKSAIAFAAATAGITSFVKMADPMGFADFQVAMAGVSIQLGRLFIPLLRDATKFVQELASWLQNNITPALQEQVSWWVKVSLMVLGGGAALSKVLGIMGTGISVIKAFGAVLGTLGMATPIGWVLALVGAVGALMGVMSSGGEGGGIFASLAPVIEYVQTLFAELSTALAPIIPPLIQIFVGLMQALAPIIPPLVAIFLAIVEAVTPLLSIFVSLVKVVVDVLKPAFDFLATVIKTVADAIKEAADWIRDAIGGERFVPNSAFSPAMTRGRPAPGGGAGTGGTGEGGGDRYTGRVGQQMQLGSIADAWRRAQVANPNDVQNRILELQLNAETRQVQLLERLADAQGRPALALPSVV